MHFELFPRFASLLLGFGAENLLTHPGQAFKAIPEDVVHICRDLFGTGEHQLLCGGCPVRRGVFLPLVAPLQNSREGASLILERICK